MLDRTSTQFSHVKPEDTQFVSGGLRDFFLYRDLGVAEATHGKVIAHLVKANMPQKQAQGGNAIKENSKSVLLPKAGPGSC